MVSSGTVFQEFVNTERGIKLVKAFYLYNLIDEILFGNIFDRAGRLNEFLLVI